jgi:hypothetical protein
MGKHGKDYSRFFWPLNLVPLVMADDLAEIADLEVKFRTTQDDAARQLALGMSGDMEEITALAHDDSLHPAQRLLAVRLAYPADSDDAARAH